MKLREDVSVCARVLDTESCDLLRTGRLGPWPFIQMEPFSALPLALALARDPSKRKLRSDIAIWQGQEEVLSFQCVCPRARRQEVTPLRVTDQEGPDPAGTLLCIPVLPLPSLREPQGQARGQLNFWFGCNWKQGKTSRARLWVTDHNLRKSDLALSNLNKHQVLK